MVDTGGCFDGRDGATGTAALASNPIKTASRTKP
jgi:hypothetical protein